MKNASHWMKPGRISGLLMFLACLHVAAIVRAQGRTIASRQTGGTLDEVVLHGGRSYRGTIAEKVPNEYVIIVTVTGRTLQFPMVAVSYAGPVRQEAVVPEEISIPSDATEFVPEEGNRLRLESPDPEVAFHMLSGTTKGAFVSYSYGNGLGWGVAASRSYTHICGAPCEFKLPPGRYKLALSKANRMPVEAARPVTIEQPSVLVGRYKDNQNIRTIGWILMGMGNLLGSSLMFASADNLDTDLLWAGMSICLTSSLISLVLVLIDDRAEIDVRPLTF